MNPIDDGGPAFAGVSGVDGYGNSEPITTQAGEVVYLNHNQGMSLRDWFAGEAMKGSVTAWEHHDVCADYATPENSRLLSSRAYKMADAMLAVRKEGA